MAGIIYKTRWRNNVCHRRRNLLTREGHQFHRGCWSRSRTSLPFILPAFRRFWTTRLGHPVARENYLSRCRNFKCYSLELSVCLRVELGPSRRIRSRCKNPVPPLADNVTGHLLFFRRDASRRPETKVATIRLIDRGNISPYPTGRYRYEEGVIVTSAACRSLFARGAVNLPNLRLAEETSFRVASD